MPHGITQCYLPPGRGDIPALTPAEAGTRLSDPGGMQGWVAYIITRSSSCQPASASPRSRWHRLRRRVACISEDCSSRATSLRAPVQQTSVWRRRFRARPARHAAVRVAIATTACVDTGPCGSAAVEVCSWRRLCSQHKHTFCIRLLLSPLFISFVFFSFNPEDLYYTHTPV